jgi:hypothetical protein
MLWPVRRAAILVAAAVAAALAACGGEDSGVTVGATVPPDTVPAETTAPSTSALPAPTTTVTTAPAPTTAVPVDCAASLAGLPPLVVAGDGQVRRIGPDGSATVPLERVNLAYAAGPGLLVAEVNEFTEGERADVVILEGDGITELDSTDGEVLYEVSDVDGVPHLFFATLPGPNIDEQPGELFHRPVAGGDPTRIDVAFAPEYGVARASQAQGLVVASAFADLTETFTFTDLAGSPRDDVFDATEGAPYNAPPLWAQAVVDPDGTRYAYLEGPDVDGVNDPETLVGEWELVIVTTAGGSQQLRLTIAGQDDRVRWFDFDGRFAVASLDDGRVLAVDTDAAAPESVVLCDVTGVATIDRFAS